MLRDLLPLLYFYSMEKPFISWSDFEKIDIRTGTILEAYDFPEARKPAYKLKIDFGPLGTRMSSAQITDRYTKSDLIGKQIIAVINFPPKQIGPFMSECLVLGVVPGRGGVSLLRPDHPLPNGLPIT